MVRPRPLLVSLVAALAVVLVPAAGAEAPHFYSPPYILEEDPPFVGDTLTGANGGVVCLPLCYKQVFQWFHCTANSNVSNCVPVSDVTEQQEYVVQAGDVGWSLVVQVTAWNFDCNEANTECRDSHTTRNSAPTAPVVGAGGGGSGTSGSTPPPPVTPIEISPLKFFAATPGIPYSAELSATGGTAPYTCATAGGMLPFGLTLTGCTVSGIPLGLPGVFTFTFALTDMNGQKAMKTYSMMVATPVILATPLGLPSGVVGTAYMMQLGATGGSAPYSFTVVDGALPAGVTLSTTGTLSGTPMASGTALFTVRIKDALGIPGTQTYRLVVEPKPTITKKPGTTKTKKKSKKTATRH